MLNIISHPQGLGRHLFGSFGGMPSFAARSLINDDGHCSDSKVSPQHCCLTPLAPVLWDGLGAWEVPDRRSRTPRALGLLPALHRASHPWLRPYLLVTSVQTGADGPASSRFSRRATEKQTTLLGWEDMESTLYISFLGKVQSGEIPGFLGRK